MARAIGYLRVSTGEQAASGLGLEAQRAAVEAAAARLGLELGAVEADEGISGAKELEDRPGLMAAVAAIRRGDVLLVAKRDRLGRDVVAVAMIERLVTRKGARVVSAAGEGTDSDDPSAVLMRRLLDAFSEYERLLIGARTRAALKAKRQRGERAGEVPYGFVAAADGRLEEEPGEQAVISAVREARSRGLAQRAIVEELAARGFVGRTGRPLALIQVQRILKAVA
jgi:site-specific DNA recombinase